MHASRGARLVVRLGGRRCHHSTVRKRRRWRCVDVPIVSVSDDSLIGIGVRDTDVARVRPAKAATPGPMLAPRARWRWAERPPPGPSLLSLLCTLSWRRIIPRMGESHCQRIIFIL